MKKVLYIKNNYPVPTLEQWKLLEKMDCDEVFVEGIDIGYPIQLEHALKNLTNKDVLLVYSLKVLFNLSNPESWFEKMSNKGIRLISVVEKFDLKKEPTFYVRYLSISKIINEISTERNEDTGRVSNIDKQKIGRPNISPKKINMIRHLSLKERMSYRQISKACDVSLGTVSKYLNNIE